MQQRVKNKFSIFIKLILLSLLFAAWSPEQATAQTQARATIVGIPQILPSPYISDFEQQVFAGNYQVQLNITGPGPVDVRFRVRITQNSQVLVDETSLPSTFDSGMHLLSPFSEFVLFEATTQQILESLPGTRFRQAWQTGRFPEGNYQITIEPEIVGSNIPGIEGIANFMVRLPQPPTLVSPSNGESIAPTLSTPVFSWSPVMGPPGMMVEYEFLLVELFDGQNPSEAIVSNRKHASAVSIGTTMLPYTGSYLPLEEGQTYAWQVTARDVNGEIPINNEGRSEVRVFTYGSEDEEEQEQLTVVEPEMTLAPIPVQIPSTTISGTVQYKFRPTEGFQSNEPVNSNSTFNLSGTNNSGVQTALDDPNYSMEDANYSGDLYSGFGNQNQESDQVSIDAQVPVYGGGETGNVQIQNFGQTTGDIQNQLAEISDNLLNHPLEGASVKAVVTVNGTDHVIATTTANEEGAYTLSFAPSELDRLLDNSDDSDSGSGSASVIGNQQNQNQTINVQDANTPVSQLQNTELALASVKIVVDSPYFTFSEDNTVAVSTKNARTYNAGAITGTALTYRLDSTVRDQEDDEPITDAKIEIFRASDWYDVVPALQPEGWPLPADQEDAQMVLNSSMMEKVAEANASRQITRLFPRKKGSNDRYMVRVDAPGYKPVVTHLSASPELSEFESATVEKVYKLQKALPVVEGRVVRRDNQSPIKNAIVALTPPVNNLTPRVTVTDSDGRFTITRIQTHTEPYKLVVQSSKSEKYEEEILLNERGVVIQRDPIMLDPTLITVVGRIQNDRSENIANATVKWQDGGSPVQTDQQGRFVTANTQGTHTLQVRKIGHRDMDTTITVEVSEEPEFDFNFERNQTRQDWSDTDISNFSTTTNQWANSVINSESFQTDDGEEEEGFSFASVGYSGNASSSYSISENFAQNETNMSMADYSSAAAYFMDIMGENGTPGDTQDIGTLVITRAVGKLDVTVESASDGSPIENATVQVGKTGPSDQTDDQGSIYFDETPAGNVPIQVQAPNTTNYVPVITETTITDNGEVTDVTISMDLGGRATGTVTAVGNPVEGATIRLEGREDIQTTTDSNGSYTLPGIPTGEWTLKAGKSGFVGDSQTTTFSEDTEQTVDFSLQDSEFNIASLLGFDIEVEELSVSPSDTTITGAIVSVPNNPLISVEPDFRIPFTNINVFEQNGKLLPVGGSVQTDMSEFNAEVFGFLQVTVSNSSGIIVRERELPTQVGYLAGKVQIDYESTFTSETGWEWPGAPKQQLVLPNLDDLPDGVGEEELVTLTSDGSFPIPDIGESDFELRISSVQESFELYGFDVNLELAESRVRSDGFHLGGEVALNNIPLLDNVGISLSELVIGINGAVKKADLDLDPKPSIGIANWALEVASGALSENGFSLGGAFELAIPGSDVSEINFSDLTISPDQIFGGQFTIPTGGLDIFGITSLQSKPGVDITFGKVQDENTYFVSGAGEIALPKYVNEPLEFKEFLIRTDGQFRANITSNFESDFFGLADLTVNEVDFNNFGGNPNIYVDGQFGLRAIPFINAQSGGLTYEPGGNVSFEEIDLDFDVVGVASVGAGIGFVDTAQKTGFSGAGNIGISDSPLDLAIDFFYEKVNTGGLMFGVDVQTGFPPIQIGTVTLSNIGGGFEYTTSESRIEVGLRATLSFAPGAEHALALDPLEVIVKAGNGAPVVEGSADVTLMTQQIADAQLTIDFGKPYFDMIANVGFNKLPDIDLDANGSARLVLSGEENNTYWMAAAYYHANLLDLFTANANIIAAWNLNVNSHPEYNEYTDFVSSEYMTGGEINGLHLDVASEFGIKKKDKVCLDFEVSDFEVGSACAYFYNSTRCKLNADFASNNFGMYLGSNWQGGGSVRLLEEDIAGADIEATGEILGGYRSNENVWWANGTADGSVEAYIGDCNVGCQTKVCWPVCGKAFGKTIHCPVPKGASVCASASITVDYRSTRGMNVDIEF
ncbi:MAG: carboxypeptidase regulatory-like domain-containing protein [Balneolaceae bacterium]|nr:carboxypeptidase regulatory-like domain-containing protein [Balneolaceae bacterium]